MAWPKSRHRATERYKGERVEQQGPSCEVCGWVPPAIVAEASGADMMPVHHLRGVASGGDHSRENLILLCPNCHAIAHSVFRQGFGSTDAPADRGEFISCLKDAMLGDGKAKRARRAAMGCEAAGLLNDLLSA